VSAVRRQAGTRRARAALLCCACGLVLLLLMEWTGRPLRPLTRMRLWRVPAAASGGAVWHGSPGWPMGHADAANSSRSPYGGPQAPRVAARVRPWLTPSALGGPGCGVAIGGDVLTRDIDKALVCFGPDLVAKWRHGEWGGASAPAIGPDGRIHAAVGRAEMVAVEPAGAVRARWALGLRAEPSTPIVRADGCVLVADVDGTEVVCVSPDKGVTWRTSLELGSGGPGYRRGNLAVGPDGDSYVAGQSAVAGLDGLGRRKWRYDSTSSILTPPVVGDDGLIRIGTSSGDVIAIRPNGSEAQRWGFGEPVTALGLTPSGEVVCAGGPFQGVEGPGCGWLSLVDARGGRRWTSRIEGYPGCMAIDSSGTVFVASEVLSAVGGGGRILWTHSFHTPLSGRIAPRWVALGPYGLYVTCNDHSIWLFATVEPA